MIRILHGDCRVMLLSLDEASVDAIVTDPPYELGFMGKGWDKSGVANDPAVWREALRVLKPGGHLLAFSGTRTYHRMTAAIEDAGFEVRDQIGWCFASGFPKSHNLDNERGRTICGCDDHMHGLRQAPDDAGRVGEEGQDAELQPPMQRQAARRGVGEARAQRCDGTQDLYAIAGGEEPGMEGRRDAQAPARKLRPGAVRQGAGMGQADGSEGRLRDGAPADDGSVVRLPADADGGGASHRPRSAAQRAGESGTVAGQPQPQAGGAWPVCGGCGLPILPRGLGTALKPAWEPICVARKPLDGTVAANVLKHGTGALNIDGCRVGISSGEREVIDSRSGADRDSREIYGAGLTRAVGETFKSHDLGRWPANVIHDGSVEVMTAFPVVTSGVKVGGQYARAIGVHEGGQRSDGTASYGDTGSAARFFYCAKADRADRNEGLDGMPETRRSDADGMLMSDPRMDKPQQRRASANHHPTVKPTDLMRYLCRLVTPKGGTVLDPFMGSGSTLKAAELEGFSAIGIELSAEYIEIAKRRIAADAPLFAEVL
jgi:hypothetical protein